MVKLPPGKTEVPKSNIEEEPTSKLTVEIVPAFVKDCEPDLLKTTLEPVDVLVNVPPFTAKSPPIFKVVILEPVDDAKFTTPAA